MGRLAVSCLRQSAAVFSQLRLGFSSSLVYLWFSTKWHWHRLLPENFVMPLSVSAHQSSIIICHSLVPTVCLFHILPYDRSLTSSKASSPHSAIYCFLFQFPVSSLFFKFFQLLLTPSSSSSRHLYPALYVGHLESKERLRIQPGQLFNFSWWVMWCVQ